MYTKKSFLLSLCSLAVLASCGGAKVEESSPASGGSESSQIQVSSSIDETSSLSSLTIEDKFDAICVPDLSMTSSFSYVLTDYEEDNEGTGTSDAILNEGAYQLNMESGFASLKNKLFAGTHNGLTAAFEHRINTDNEVEAVLYVEDGYYYEFETFENPLEDAFLNAFEPSADNPNIYEMDVTDENHTDSALQFVFLATGFYVEGLEYFRLVADDDRITSIQFKTTEWMDTHSYENVILTGEITLDVSARIVEDIEPYSEKSYASTLDGAFKNFESNGVLAETKKTAKEGVESDEYAMDVKTWIVDDLLYIQYLDNPYETGYVVKDGYVRQIVQDDEDSSYLYNAYDYVYTYDEDYNMVPLTNLSSYLPVRAITPHAFEYDETTGEYYVTGTYAYTFFFNYNFAYFNVEYYNMLSIDKVSIKLSEDNTRLVEMKAEADEYIYDVSYSNFEYPFDIASLGKYDPSILFNGTYTGQCSIFGDSTCTIVIDNVANGARSLTIDGVAYECTYEDSQIHFTYNNSEYYFVRTYDDGLELYDSDDESVGEFYAPEGEITE